ncbi:MAG: hypothetical protein O3B95_12530 [Chloroflexi bacterium]|nr:hypothetical protein [Chloroflexota bacterium]
MRPVLIGLVSFAGFTAVACGSPGESEKGTPVSTGQSTPPVAAVSSPGSNGGASFSGVPGIPGPGWTVISDLIRLELATPDLGVGSQRFGVVLSDDSGLIKFPIVRLTSNYYPDGYEAEPDKSLSSSVPARFYEFPFGTRGIHSTVVQFDRVGLWSVSAEIPRSDGTSAPVEVRFPVAKTAMSVTVGQPAPASMSRTLGMVSSIRELTTGSIRDEGLYRYSIAEALERDRPLLIVFASPAFCTNAVCGPQVEIASELREVYGDRVDFVHVDLYSNPHEIQGDLSRAVLSPLLEEWRLSSQEWTFIVGPDGIVTHRFENFAPKPELVEALEQTLSVG